MRGDFIHTAQLYDYYLAEHRLEIFIHSNLGHGRYELNLSFLSHTNSRNRMRTTKLLNSLFEH